jgi:hypothetical protein
LGIWVRRGGICFLKGLRPFKLPLINEMYGKGIASGGRISKRLAINGCNVYEIISYPESLLL